jgi:hypothetical protein
MMRKNPPQAAVVSTQAVRRVAFRLKPLLVEKVFHLCYTKEEEKESRGEGAKRDGQSDDHHPTGVKSSATTRGLVYSYSGPFQSCGRLLL